MEECGEVVSEAEIKEMIKDVLNALRTSCFIMIRVDSNVIDCVYDSSEVQGYHRVFILDASSVRLNSYTMNHTGRILNHVQ